jgi:hypothetical protein
MNYKKLVLTLKDERHSVIFIVEIQNDAPKSIKVNFLKLPIGADLGFYIGRYANDTTEEIIISDILKRLDIDKNSGNYFIGEEYSK